MRLDFNVLWVDDQPNRVEAQIKSIERQMEEEGFRFSPTLCKSIDETRARIADNVFTDEIDLVLVDWDLGAGTYGEDAIAAIREHVRYKDVVFYSAMKPAAELRELASKNSIEGVFCAASREDLVEEVMGVFESLVKKVLDLDHARGIVMGATSDIDFMVNQCLAAIHDQLDDPGKEAMLKEVLGRIDDRIKDLVERAKKLQAAASIAEVFEAHMVFTANDRLRILSRMLKVQQFKAHGEARATVITYLDNVVPDRNDLAHLILVPEGRPQAVMTLQGKTVTLEETRTLRRQILGLRDEFRGLLAALTAVQRG